MAEAFNLPVVSHGVPEIHVHLVGAAPNGLTVEYMPRLFPLWKEVPQPVDGDLLMPTAPGLGLEFDQARSTNTGRNPVSVIDEHSLVRCRTDRMGDRPRDAAACGNRPRYRRDESDVCGIRGGSRPGQLRQRVVRVDAGDRSTDRGRLAVEASCLGAYRPVRIEAPRHQAAVI